VNHPDSPFTPPPVTFRSNDFSSGATPESIKLPDFVPLEESIPLYCFELRAHFGAHPIPDSPRFIVGGDEPGQVLLDLSFLDIPFAMTLRDGYKKWREIIEAVNTFNQEFYADLNLLERFKNRNLTAATLVEMNKALQDWDQCAIATRLHPAGWRDSVMHIIGLKPWFMPKRAYANACHNVDLTRDEVAQLTGFLQYTEEGAALLIGERLSVHLTDTGVKLRIWETKPFAGQWESVTTGRPRKWRPQGQPFDEISSDYRDNTQEARDKIREAIEGVTPQIVQVDQVVQRADGTKYCARSCHELPMGATIVADTPHGDGDYSYMCNHPHCRCSE
jgi:hypothetical protein